MNDTAILTLSKISFYQYIYQLFIHLYDWETYIALGTVN